MPKRKSPDLPESDDTQATQAMQSTHVEKKVKVINHLPFNIINIIHVFNVGPNESVRVSDVDECIPGDKKVMSSAQPILTLEKLVAAFLADKLPAIEEKENDDDLNRQLRLHECIRLMGYKDGSFEDVDDMMLSEIVDGDKRLYVRLVQPGEGQTCMGCEELFSNSKEFSDALYCTGCGLRCHARCLDVDEFHTWHTTRGIEVYNFPCGARVDRCGLEIIPTTCSDCPQTTLATHYDPDSGDTLCGPCAQKRTDIREEISSECTLCESTDSQVRYTILTACDQRNTCQSICLACAENYEPCRCENYVLKEELVTN